MPGQRCRRSCRAAPTSGTSSPAPAWSQAASACHDPADRTLTREQQARGQLLTNAAVDAALGALASSAGWGRATPPEREKLVRAALTRARSYARDEAVAAFGSDPAPGAGGGRTPAAPSGPRAPTPTRTDVDPERSAGARRAAETRARNAAATAEARTQPPAAGRAPAGGRSPSGPPSPPKPPAAPKPPAPPR